jgi:signal transduction histidine kinase
MNPADRDNGINASGLMVLGPRFPPDSRSDSAAEVAVSESPPDNPLPEEQQATRKTASLAQARTEGRTPAHYGGEEQIGIPAPPDPAGEALIRANRQLNLIAGITRHDIGNKLMVLSGHIELAKELCRDPGIQTILEKLEAGVHAIRADIEFTRIFRDFGAVPPEWHDISEILAGLTLPKRLELRTDRDRIMILADPGLKKVFANLLDNTVRHGHGATRISVRTREGPDGLVLSWEDNGAGVAQEFKEQIFKRGFGSNNGLGLYYSQEILALTGATIRETGSAGSGARFEMHFPPGTYRLAGRETPSDNSRS